MDEGTKASLMRNFEKSIYPVWAPIFQRAKENEKITEVQAMHLADMAIFDSGIKPERESSFTDGNREAVQGKYRQVYR